MKRIKHEELRGNKMVIDAFLISENEYEVMVLDTNGEEIDCVNVSTETEAIEKFDKMVSKYAEPFQKAIYNAKLEENEKYTLVYFNDFGFPVAQKITFSSLMLCTYAQFSDCVKMTFIPYRKRKMYSKTFFNSSILIFKGWQELKEEDTHIIEHEDDNMRVTRSKYGCFDSKYIEDVQKKFKNPVCIYKNYNIGVSGKLYA